MSFISKWLSISLNVSQCLMIFNDWFIDRVLMTNGQTYRQQQLLSRLKKLIIANDRGCSDIILLVMLTLRRLWWQIMIKSAEFVAKWVTQNSIMRSTCSPTQVKSPTHADTATKHSMILATELNMKENCMKCNISHEINEICLSYNSNNYMQ